MPDKSDNSLNFWQELKRRKVVRIVIAYAAAAFVLLELVDIIAEPLGLPSWTLNMVIVLLCIGFVIAVILTWIYDITPEGVRKTKPWKGVKVSEKPPTSNIWKIVSYISIVVIIVLISINVVGNRKKTESLTRLEKSIAVLPFENLSEEKGNEHFVDGLVEDLLNRISVIEELKVISRTSSEKYRERGVKSVPEIAKELGVSFIVEGSVQRYGDKARITVQLIDAVNDDHLWADNYDRDVVDVFKTQSEIAIQIASELNAILTSEQRAYIQEDKTINVKAFELYQLGRFYWSKRTGDGYNTSIEYFEQAIEEDPAYGLAYAGLADTYNLMALQGWIDKQEGRDKAEELAFKALALDENLVEAYTVLGSIYDYVDWDWENAERVFKKALELNPNYATAHHYYSQHLHIIGRNEEAWEHIDKAVELDPLSFVIRYVRGFEMYNNDFLFEEALSEIEKCNELHENHPWIAPAELEIYWQLGDKDKAYETLMKILESNSIYDLETAGNIYKISGLKAVLEWKMNIDQSGGESDFKSTYFDIATTYGLIGEDEKAIEYLEKAYISSAIAPTISYRIVFKNLHSNPGYIALLKKMNLKQ